MVGESGCDGWNLRLKVKAASSKIVSRWVETWAVAWQRVQLVPVMTQPVERQRGSVRSVRGVVHTEWIVSGFLLRLDVGFQ